MQGRAAVVGLYIEVCSKVDDGIHHSLDCQVVCFIHGGKHVQSSMSIYVLSVNVRLLLQENHHQGFTEVKGCHVKWRALRLLIFLIHVFTHQNALLEPVELVASNGVHQPGRLSKGSRCSMDTSSYPVLGSWPRSNSTLVNFNVRCFAT